ncbi:MAG: 4-hydroxy-3-methylbut-2-enyl diphosphate reductase [Candidatus Omnitrophica bacterium]|nr:4-hydroxy-3-methylbut-2-enyl diphosphate reductase [Candidatus Omnitrophota bacterium]
MPNRNARLAINRRGFGLKEAVAGKLAQEYKSELVKSLREHGSTLLFSDLQILLAKEFGFCYGVDRAVDYAYETRKKFPDRIIYITTEIIHNPRVNRKLREMGIRFLSGCQSENYQFSDVKKEDVVILPAFGASVNDMERLVDIGCTLVDTTCGSVMNVWKRVERNAKDGFTSVIHGKYYHEETIATSSRALQFDGRYLVVRDEKEAQIACDYILEKGDRALFLEHFKNSVSPGFDPDRDLQRVGIANQTTMLSSESMHISKMIEQAMCQQYGEENIQEHFRAFDTICSATQERQDAIIEMGQKKPDLIIVVGGYNSSNTNHLSEIGSRFAPTYHICESDCIISTSEIRHKLYDQSEEMVTRDWLPAGPVKVGITSGASTPDKVVEETMIRILACRGHNLQEALALLQSPGLN